MASIIKQTGKDKKPDGRVMLQFRRDTGKRGTLYLGRVDDPTARDIKQHVEHLLRCLKYGTPTSPATDQWLSGLVADPSQVWLYDRMAAVGLVAERSEQADARSRDQAARNALGPFLDRYIASRGDVKPTTKLLYSQTRGNLIERFGADKPLAEITAGDAAEFKTWLHTGAKQQGAGKRAGLARATANRRTRCAKQFFEAAVDHELIDRNPFRKVKSGSSVNRSRLFFVSRSVAEAIIDRCPDAEWRAIIALSRFGGIRIPSELHPLRWEDVNFEQNKLTIASPKTEHLDKPYRVIPDEVFRDVRPYLEDLFELQRSRGPVKPKDFVITRYRERNANLRTQLLRIMKRAGVEPWPKLFQNMRSSRETELIYLGYHIHEVCSWIGNSPQVANTHYLQVLESCQKAELERDAQAQSQNALQFGNAAGGNGLTASSCTNHREPQENQQKTAFSPCFDGVDQYAQEDSNLRPAD